MSAHRETGETAPVRIDPLPDLSELLTFEPSEGRILLRDYRMVLWSARALGALRKELIATLGADAARGVLKRFGYAAGLADGASLAERFPEADENRHLVLGPALHAIEGVARVERDAARTHVDLKAGIFHVEGFWHGSYEAEQHVEESGPSSTPVCWSTVGYATGHSSSAAGRAVLVVETECVAMGHERCRFVSDFAEVGAEEFPQEAKDYRARHLPAVLERLESRLRKRERDVARRDAEIEELRSELSRRGDRAAGGLLFESPQMAHAVRIADRAAPFASTVLILGESGTGKELLAQRIHERSTRADAGAIVAVNCSALPEALEESELFGHARGAFTGAERAREGLFETAHRGTIFLDEVGDLSASSQTKLLRVLQEGEVRRVGETKTRKVDVRVIAATHRDLIARVADGTFREDLYYRLAVVTVELPPLRARGHDILLLAERFAHAIAERFERPARPLSRAAKCAIMEHAWPGNVRELEHAIEHAVIMADGDAIQRGDLPAGLAAAPGDPRRAPIRSGAEAGQGPEGSTAGASGDRSRDRDGVEEALRLARGKREVAAEILGVSRTTLWRRMRELGLQTSR